MVFIITIKGRIPNKRFLYNQGVSEGVFLPGKFRGMSKSNKNTPHSLLASITSHLRRLALESKSEQWKAKYNVAIYRKR